MRNIHSWMSCCWVHALLTSREHINYTSLRTLCPASARVFRKWNFMTSEVKGQELALLSACMKGNFTVCACVCVLVCVHSRRACLRACEYCTSICALPVWDDEVTGPSLLTSKFNLDLHNPGVNFHRVQPSGVSRQVTGVRQLSHVPLLHRQTAASKQAGEEERKKHLT